MRYGRRLQELRIEAGVSLASLAARTGRETAQLEAIEAGTGDVSLMTILEIANGLDMTAGRFFRMISDD